MKSRPHPFLRDLAMLSTMAENKQKGKKTTAGYRDNNARAFYDNEVTKDKVQHLDVKQVSDITDWMTDQVLKVSPSFKQKPIKFFLAYKSIRYPSKWVVSTYNCSFIGRYIAFPKKVALHMLNNVWTTNDHDKHPCIVIYWSQDGYCVESKHTENEKELIDAVEKFIDEVDELCF